VQATFERAISALVLGAGVDPANGNAVTAFLGSLELEPAERAALAKNLDGLLVYRKLVRARLREALELAAPRALARLGPLFDDYFDRFLAERGPRTHYLRDVTQEWLDFCEPLWAGDARVPGYLIDLARHEALAIIVASGADPAPAADAGTLDLARGLRFIEAARVVRYRHAVHELSEDTDDRTEPRAGATALFVYRSPEHDVRYLELTPLAAGILERLLAGATLGDAVTRAAGAAGVPLESSVLEGTARLLAELAERGALLGPTAQAPEEAAKLAPSPADPAFSPVPKERP
jgi:hypothetical protein